MMGGKHGYDIKEKNSMSYGITKNCENSTETFSYKDRLTKVNHRRGSDK
jgi:hypothetical protein